MVKKAVEHDPINDEPIYNPSEVILKEVPDPETVKRSLLAEIDVAKQVLFSTAQKGELFPVPLVLSVGLDGTDDVLLAEWRAYDIYATWHNKKWMIRADKVR